MGGKNNAIASVTVITDGYENASKEYSHKAIKSLIEAYKSEGWLFAYIGADHDVEAVAFNLAIDNHMAFEKSEVGTAHMFDKFQSCRSRFVNEMASMMNNEDIDADEKKELLIKRSKSFFKPESAQ